jgi:hypothetical protein
MSAATSGNFFGPCPVLPRIPIVTQRENRMPCSGASPDFIIFYGKVIIKEDPGSHTHKHLSSGMSFLFFHWYQRYSVVICQLKGFFTGSTKNTIMKKNRKSTIIGSGETGINRSSSRWNHENDFLNDGPRFRTSPKHGEQGVFCIVTNPARGRPFGSGGNHHHLIDKRFQFRIATDNHDFHGKIL